MERIKKKMVNATTAPSIINELINLYDEYSRNCDRQPYKQVKWNTWFLTECFVVLLKHEDVFGSTLHQ